MNYNMNEAIYVTERGKIILAIKKLAYSLYSVDEPLEIEKEKSTELGYLLKQLFEFEKLNSKQPSFDGFTINELKRQLDQDTNIDIEDIHKQKKSKSDY